jgi:hypothetical protein
MQQIIMNRIILLTNQLLSVHSTTHLDFQVIPEYHHTIGFGAVTTIKAF